MEAGRLALEADNLFDNSYYDYCTIPANQSPSDLNSASRTSP
jgi:hypothetical protein